jgi:hypothetical protein
LETYLYEKILLAPDVREVIKKDFKIEELKREILVEEQIGANKLSMDTSSLDDDGY